MLKNKTIFSSNKLESWTNDLATASVFAKGGVSGDPEKNGKKIKVTFRVVGGVVRGTGIAHLSQHPEQQEVIVSKKQKFRVERIVRDVNEYDELGANLTEKGYKMFRIYVRAV